MELVRWFQDLGKDDTPASAGIHEGRVRIVTDPGQAHLEAGDVLVAPGTDPAWTPLFLTAGALVTEIGGIISHGSVVLHLKGLPFQLWGDFLSA